MPRMGVPEFRELVGGVSRLGEDNDFVRAEIEREFEEKGELLQERAQAVIKSARERAGNWVLASREEEYGDDTPRTDYGLNPEAALVSKAIAKRLEPWTRTLREEGFGGPDAPFPGDEEAAADWIEAQSVIDRERWKKDSGSKSDAVKEIRRLADLAGLVVDPRPRLLK